MRRRIPIFTEALSISLIAHGLGLSGLAWWYIAHTPPPKLAALDRVQVLLDAMPKTQLPPPLPTPPKPPAPKPAAPAPPLVAKKPPPPPIKYDKPEDPRHDDSGEANGTGTANRSTEGKQPMLANAGRFEQADLMKEADQFAEDVFLPASKGEVTGNDAPPEKSQQQGAIARDSVAQVKPIQPGPNPQMEKPPVGTGPMPAVKETAPVLQAVAGIKAPQSKLPVAQTPVPKPVRKEIRGHRATMSDTESIAFAKAENTVFQAGKLQGRKGLRTRTTIPRLGDASRADLEVMGRLHLVLGVTVELDGSVQNVEVLESSGSQNVDQDFKNEVWNQWNLEPRKDAGGHAIDLNWVVTCE